MPFLSSNDIHCSEYTRMSVSKPEKYVWRIKAHPKQQQVISINLYPYNFSCDTCQADCYERAIPYAMPGTTYVLYLVYRFPYTQAHLYYSAKSNIRRTSSTWQDRRVWPVSDIHILNTRVIIKVSMLSILVRKKAARRGTSTQIMSLFGDIL